MEVTRFDAMVQRMAGDGTRRTLVGALAGLGLGAAALPGLAAAKKNNNKDNNKKKKKRFCLNGENVKAKNKKKKNRLRREGAVRGRCQGCTPVCPTDGTCGGDDGCGGVCGCGAGTVCDSGTCVACTVTCTSDAATCGAALQAALAVSSTVYACPGLYAAPAGGFAFNLLNTSLYGAGSGDDQASNTILDGQGANIAVINSPLPGAVTLSGLRITGGNSALGAGGIVGLSDLTVENCAIVDNTGSLAGGINMLASVTMSNSLVSGNTSTGANSVGGIVIAPIASVLPSTITNSVIEDNTGLAVGGVSLITNNVQQTLTVASTSQITNNTATGSVTAGGIAHSGLGSANATGATVTGNTNPQCFQVTGC